MDKETESRLKQVGLVIAGSAIIYFLIRENEQKSEEPPVVDLPELQQFIDYTKTIPLGSGTTKYPIYKIANDWTNTSVNEWTSGFYPALTCWIYGKTRSSSDLTKAINTVSTFYTDDGVNWNSHDQYIAIALIKGLNLITQSNPNYTNWKNKAMSHANRLVDIQYNSTIGAIPTYTGSQTVIADSMTMAIPLLIWAYNNSSDTQKKNQYMNIIISHSDVIIRDHFTGKTDAGSVWQRVGYNTNGSVSWKDNNQAENPDKSNPDITWARAQSWVMYGFTELYEFTGLDKYLTAFMGAANFWMSSLSAWSDNGVMKNTIGATYPKYDTSATVIAIASLFKMSRLISDSMLKGAYLAAARLSFNRLISSSYLVNGKLIHGYYNSGATDAETIWGDYFLSETFDRRY